MAFNLEGQRWDHTTITWSIATASYTGQPGGAFSFSISDSIIINDIVNAFSQWDNASGLSFVQVPDGQNVDIRIGYGVIDGNAGSTIGRTNYFYSGSFFNSGVTIRFDSDENYFTQNGEVYIDNTGNPVRSLALHEIGHALGLDHYNGANAVMNNASGTNITLQPSDIEGIQYLYGPGNTTTVTGNPTLNGHSYRFIPFNGTALSWSQARDVAAALGGYLATITSQAENDFILNNVVSNQLVNGSTAAFIGASDAGHEGTWQWATGPETGTTFWSGGATVSGRYAHWRADLPSNSSNNSEGSENFAVMEGDGSWNDVTSLRPANITVGYVVEFPIGNTTVSVNDQTTHVQTVPAGTPYSGPVAGLHYQYINLSSDNLNVTGIAPNGFIHTGSGFDAIDVSKVSGTNVLDGGTNSNFLVGGTAAGSFDTFFVDNRSPPGDIWSTVGNFHKGDDATVWGVTQAGFKTFFVDGEGAAGFTGVTLHVTKSGVPTASLTLAGYSTADLNNGRLSTSFGSVGGNDYFYVHANG